MYVCVIMLDPVELELEIVVSYHVGIEPRSAGSAVSALNLRAISPAPERSFLKNKNNKTSFGEESNLFTKL